MCVCGCVWVGACVCVCVYVCMCMNINMYVYAYMHVYMCVCVYKAVACASVTSTVIFVCESVCLCVRECWHVKSLAFSREFASECPPGNMYTHTIYNTYIYTHTYITSTNFNMINIHTHTYTAKHTHTHTQYVASLRVSALLVSHPSVYPCLSHTHTHTYTHTHTHYIYICIHTHTHTHTRDPTKPRDPPRSGLFSICRNLPGAVRNRARSFVQESDSFIEIRSEAL